MRKGVKNYEDWVVQKGVLQSVHFDLTYKCNQDCKHCYLDKKMHGCLLTTRQVKGIIDDLRAFNVAMLQFSGGELFLRDDVPEILSYAAQKRFVLYLKTNGTLISPLIAKQLAKNKFIRRIDVSLLGAKASTHDSITGRVGSFSEALRGIKLLTTYLPPGNVRILFIPLRENYKEVGALERRLKQYACSFQGDFIHILPSFDVKKDSQSHMLNDFEQYNLLKLNRDRNNLLLSGRYNKYAYVCTVGRSTVSIDPFGHVHPCTSLTSINWGCCLEKGIKEIWEGRSLKGFKVKYIPKCNNCLFLGYCKICPASNYLESNNLLEPSKEKCKTAVVLKKFAEESSSRIYP